MRGRSWSSVCSSVVGPEDEAETGRRAAGAPIEMKAQTWNQKQDSHLSGFGRWFPLWWTGWKCWSASVWGCNQKRFSACSEDHNNTRACRSLIYRSSSIFIWSHSDVWRLLEFQFQQSFSFLKSDKHWQTGVLWEEQQVLETAAWTSESSSGLENHFNPKLEGSNLRNLKDAF